MEVRSDVSILKYNSSNIHRHTSLLDLLWPLWVPAALEVQDVPETDSYMNKSIR